MPLSAYAEDPLPCCSLLLAIHSFEPSHIVRMLGRILVHEGATREQFYCRIHNNAVSLA